MFTLSCVLIFSFLSIQAQASDASTAKTRVTALANPYLIVPFDYDTEYTRYAVEYEVEDYINTSLANYGIDASVTVTWSSPPSSIKTAVASKTYSFKVVIDGYDGSTATVTKKMNVAITSESNIAKTAITNASKPYLEVEFNYDKATTVEDVEYAVEEYFSTYLSDLDKDAMLTIKWTTPPTTMKTAVAAKDYNFAITMEGYDGSVDKITAKLVNIAIPSEANKAKTKINSVGTPYLNVIFNTDRATTIEDVQYAVQEYLVELISEDDIYVDFTVKWSSPPKTITGPVAVANYNFAITIDGSDSSIETVTKAFNIAVVTEASLAKSLLSSVANPVLEVGYVTDRETTIETVEYAVGEYYNDILWEEELYVDLSVTWSNPPSTLTGAVGATNFNFLLTMEGTDGSLETLTKSANIVITSDTSSALIKMQNAPNPVLDIIFDTDRDTTIEAVEYAVSEFYDEYLTEVGIDSVTVTAVWNNPPSILTGAVPAADYTVSIILDGYDESRETVTKAMNLVIVTEANQAKLKLSEAEKLVLIEQFDTDGDTTIANVERTVSEYYEGCLMAQELENVTVTAVWNTPPTILTGAVSVADYDFTIVLDGLDGSSETVTKSVNIEIYTDANKALEAIRTAEKFVMELHSDYETTEDAEWAVAQYYSALIDEDYPITVTAVWDSAPEQLLGEIEATDYSFTLLLEGYADGSDETIQIMVNITVLAEPEEEELVVEEPIIEEPAVEEPTVEESVVTEELNEEIEDALDEVLEEVIAGITSIVNEI